MKISKQVYAQVIYRLSKNNREFKWHPKIAAIAATFCLNSRASPSRKCIPWLVSYESKPRYDLHLFEPTFIVTEAKIIPGSPKGVNGWFLGQSDPCTGWYLPRVEGKCLELKSADITAFRQYKISVSEYIEKYEKPLSDHLYDDATWLAALSTSS